MVPASANYPDPSAPETPAKTINEYMKKKCKQRFTDLISFCTIYSVYFAFAAIVGMYHAWDRESFLCWFWKAI